MKFWDRKTGDVSRCEATQQKDLTVARLTTLVSIRRAKEIAIIVRKTEQEERKDIRTGRLSSNRINITRWLSLQRRRVESLKKPANRMKN